jgi:hypothetical protein
MRQGEIMSGHLLCQELRSMNPHSFSFRYAEKSIEDELLEGAVRQKIVSRPQMVLLRCFAVCPTNLINGR